MKEKDLFDLFNNNQHKLTERPSERSWRRLEQKLDAHRQRGKYAIYRHLTMAAVLLALVIFTALVSFWLGKQQAIPYAGETSLKSATFEQLQAEQTDQDAYQIAQFQKQYAQNDHQIVEGKRGQKLLNAKAVNLKVRQSTSEANQKTLWVVIGVLEGE